jgi:hypothetical protein
VSVGVCVRVCRAGGGRRRGGGEGGGRGGWFLHDDRDGDDGRRVVTMGGGGGGFGGGRRNPGGLANDWKDAQRATYNSQEEDPPRGGPKSGGRGGGHGSGGRGGSRRDADEVEGSRRQVTLTHGDSRVRGPLPPCPVAPWLCPCRGRGGQVLRRQRGGRLLAEFQGKGWGAPVATACREAQCALSFTLLVQTHSSSGRIPPFCGLETGGGGGGGGGGLQIAQGPAAARKNNSKQPKAADESIIVSVGAGGRKVRKAEGGGGGGGGGSGQVRVWLRTQLVSRAVAWQRSAREPHLAVPRSAVCLTVR